MFKNYIQINSSLKPGKTMILVSGHFHHFRGPPCWIYRPSRATCFVVFKKIIFMETDCGSKTNEIEAQGLDLHLCIIFQRKKKI